MFSEVEVCPLCTWGPIIWKHPSVQIGAGTLSSGNPANQNNPYGLTGHDTVIKQRLISNRWLLADAQFFFLLFYDSPQPPPPPLQSPPFYFILQHNSLKSFICT